MDERPPLKDAQFYRTAWRAISHNGGVDFVGVKSISPLAKLGNPAEINIFDPMHLIYRGNGKLILERFFTSTRFHLFISVTQTYNCTIRQQS